MFGVLCQSCGYLSACCHARPAGLRAPFGITFHYLFRQAEIYLRVYQRCQRHESVARIDVSVVASARPVHQFYVELNQLRAVARLSVGYVVHESYQRHLLQHVGIRPAVFAVIVAVIFQVSGVFSAFRHVCPIVKGSSPFGYLYFAEHRCAQRPVGKGVDEHAVEARRAGSKRHKPH